MNASVKKAAVFGAGSMGGGIAAQFANAGVPVLLFDVGGKDDPRGVARAGIARQMKSNGFTHPDRAGLVEPCGVEVDLARLSDVDWIVESVVEDLEIKRELFRRIDSARRPSSFVSSNTSTIPLAKLVEGQSTAFARDFVITHFFNPPRVMPLVEIVAGATSGATAKDVGRAAGDILGKTALCCRDTPGFVANRIGCFWIAMTILEAMRAGLALEDADAIASRPFRIPSSGAFGLMDLIGIDLVPHVWGSLQSQLPKSDWLWRYDLAANPVLGHLIARGSLGRKSGAGFYRPAERGAVRTKETFDPASLSYRAGRAPDAAAKGDLRKLCEDDTAAGHFAWRVLSRLVVYAATAAPEIAENIADVDLGLRLGYNWAEGPFQIAERVGLSWIVESLAAEGETIPPLLEQAAARGGFYPDKTFAIKTAAPYAPGKVEDPARPLAAMKRKLVFENSGAALWDIGDGVLAFEHRTKMNIYDAHVFVAIGIALEETRRGFLALVVGSDHPRAFSCGADLGFFLGRMKAGDYAALDHFLSYGQEQFLGLKYAPFPVVAAAHGLALGGGCETLLHMREIVAHCELGAGLPESTLGILPGWGGCTQLAIRARQKAGAAKGPVACLHDPFLFILGGKFGDSALKSVDSGVLRSSDEIVMNRAQVIARAKARALELARDYTPPAPEAFFLPGPSGKSSLMSIAHTERDLGRLSENDLAVAEALATVLSGGATDPLVAITELDMMKLEREAVILLAHRPATFARIEHMLATGKPLRN